MFVIYFVTRDQLFKWIIPIVHNSVVISLVTAYVGKQKKQSVMSLDRVKTEIFKKWCTSNKCKIMLENPTNKNRI